MPLAGCGRGIEKCPAARGLAVLDLELHLTFDNLPRIRRYVHTVTRDGKLYCKRASAVEVNSIEDLGVES
jgi:hypothetical protein